MQLSALPTFSEDGDSCGGEHEDEMGDEVPVAPASVAHSSEHTQKELAEAQAQQALTNHM